MKKNVVALLIVCVVSVVSTGFLIACGENAQQSKSSSSTATLSSAPSEQPATEVAAFESTDWKSYSIRINGSIFKLPCALSEFDKTGLQTKIYSPGQKKSDGTYQTAARIYKNDPNLAWLGTTFWADSEDPSPDEITVKSLVAERDAKAKADCEVALPGEIVWGQSTIDEAIAAYGEPEDEQATPYLERFDVSTIYTWRDVAEGTSNGRLDLGVDEEGVITHFFLARPGSGVGA